MVSVNNVFDNCGAPETRGTAFNPSSYYSYQPDAPSDLPAVIRQYSGSGKISFTVGADKTQNIGVNAFVMLQSYPNPFNPSTNISFSVPHSGRIQVGIYNVMGQEIKRLFDGEVIGGETYRTMFEAKPHSSGIYFARLITPTGAQSIKLIILK